MRPYDESKDPNHQFVERHNGGHQAIVSAYRALNADLDREDVVKMRRRLGDLDRLFESAADLYKQGKLQQALEALPTEETIADLVNEADSLILKPRTINVHDAKTASSDDSLADELLGKTSSSDEQPEPETAPPAPAQEESTPQTTAEKKLLEGNMPTTADVIEAIRANALPDGVRKVLHDKEFTPEDLEMAMKIGRWFNRRRAPRRGMYS